MGFGSSVLSHVSVSVSVFWFRVFAVLHWFSSVSGVFAGGWFRVSGWCAELRGTGCCLHLVPPLCLLVGGWCRRFPLFSSVFGAVLCCFVCSWCKVPGPRFEFDVRVRVGGASVFVAISLCFKVFSLVRLWLPAGTVR